METRRPSTTRILIADDHPIFRDGLKRLLESEREFKVVGEACDGVEAVNMVRQLKPEILLLDLAMPRRPGLEALREMSDGLLLKSIRAVMNGEYWVGRESVSNLVQYLRTLVDSSSNESRKKKYGLTPRELEIISAVVAGYANKEIAKYFTISEDTVKHHLSNIFDKLGVSTRLELALFAVNQSLPFKPIS